MEITRDKRQRPPGTVSRPHTTRNARTGLCNRDVLLGTLFEGASQKDSSVIAAKRNVAGLISASLQRCNLKIFERSRCGSAAGALNHETRKQIQKIRALRRLCAWADAIDSGDGWQNRGCSWSCKFSAGSIVLARCRHQHWNKIHSGSDEGIRTTGGNCRGRL